jgi:hypothetical protein
VNEHKSIRADLSLRVLHVQLRADLDAALDGSSDRTEISVHLVHPLGGLAVGRVQLQVVVHVDAFDDQHAAVRLDLAAGFGNQFSIACRDLARLQRTTKGAGQSAGGGRHHIIQRGGMGFMDVGIDTVVLGDFGMHSKKNRVWNVRQISPAQRTVNTFDSDPGCVSDIVGHREPP